MRAATCFSSANYTAQVDCGLVLQLRDNMMRRLERLASTRMLGLACSSLWLQVSAIGLGMQTPSPQRPSPSSPPVAQTQLDLSVRETLQQYSAAYESLDAERVKKIHPAIDLETLKRTFRDMRELKVSIDSVKVLSTDGNITRVSARIMQQLTPRAGTKQTTNITRVFRLRKQEAAWVIDGFER